VALKQWEELLKSYPDLTYDIAVAGKQWQGSKPWDARNRQRYLEKETSLDEL
jgi:hypothetical protein